MTTAKLDTAKFDNLLEQLIASSEDTRLVDLDDLAAALAPFNASHEEIDHVIEQLERAGRTVDVQTRSDTSLTDDLKRVLPAAQSLRKTLGRTPTIAELEDASTLSAVRVQRALLYGRVLGRGRRV